MSVSLNHKTILQTNDVVLLQCGEISISGVVVGSGEGTFSYYDGPEFLLYAPFLLSNLFDNEDEMEIDIGYFLAEITTSSIPFSVLPITVNVKLLYNNNMETNKTQEGEEAEVTITSIVAMKELGKLLVSAYVER